MRDAIRQEKEEAPKLDELQTHEHELPTVSDVKLDSNTQAIFYVAS